MKKLVWLLIVAMALGLSVVGCNKPSSEVEPIVSRETIGSETVNEATIDVVEEKGSEAPKSELLIKAEEYEAYLQAEHQKFEEQVKHSRFNTPDSVTLENIKNNEIESRYYYDENKKIKAYDFEYDERNCTCKYKIISAKGQELEYKAVFQRDPCREKFKYQTDFHGRHAYYDFDPDIYYLISIELVSEISAKQIVYDEAMPVWSVVNMEYDENKETIIPILEQYEDENQPFYNMYNDTVNKSLVLDYVKANFTGSDYDEYLVVYAKQSNEDASFPERLKCVLVDGDTVKKSFDIPVVLFNSIDTFENKNIGYDFGYVFSHGIIDDYNNDGLNEIYFYATSLVHTYCLCVIEYNAGFNIYFIDDNLLSGIFSEKKYRSLRLESDECLFNGYDYIEEQDVKVGFEIYAKTHSVMNYVEDYNEWILKSYNRYF